MGSHGHPPWPAPWYRGWAGWHRAGLHRAIARRVRGGSPAADRVRFPPKMSFCCCSYENGSRAGGYMGQSLMNLDELRTALTELDGRLLELVARRQSLSEQVAAVKRATGTAIRDFCREREVILRGRTAAERLGVPPDLAESLLRQLIQSSLTTQEQARVAAQGQ